MHKNLKVLLGRGLKLLAGRDLKVFEDMYMDVLVNTDLACLGDKILKGLV